jgi:hypothetical protein
MISIALSSPSIDWEEIFAPSRAIDDVMDYAYTTVEEMEVLDVEPKSRSPTYLPGRTTSTTSWKCSSCVVSAVT